MSMRNRLEPEASLDALLEQQREAVDVDLLPERHHPDDGGDAARRERLVTEAAIKGEKPPPVEEVDDDDLIDIYEKARAEYESCRLVPIPQTAPFRRRRAAQQPDYDGNQNRLAF